MGALDVGYRFVAGEPIGGRVISQPPPMRGAGYYNRGLVVVVTSRRVDCGRGVRK